MRVCQPGPLAFQRARVSGGSRSEISMRVLPVFGRPRGQAVDLRRSAHRSSVVAQSSAPGVRSHSLRMAFR